MIHRSIVPVLVLGLAAGAALGQKPNEKPAPAPAPAAPAAASAPGKPESVQDRASYSIGLNLGRSFKSNEVNVNLDLLLKGVKDALSGVTPALTDEEMQGAMQALQQDVLAKQQEKQKVQGEKNKKEGDDFLAKNKAKAGVTTTASGLQYEVLTAGSGDSPKPTDTVTVNYKGTLIDGTTFDSSYDRGEPATFVLNQVIGGWTEGVGLMKPGAKYKLYIPPALGYGDRGAGPTIGPSSVLIFEVELISIGAPKTEEAKPAEPKKDPGQP
jgi:FKBP-type peptidyl-prolyl cis-trans isomerase